MPEEEVKEKVEAAETDDGANRGPADEQIVIVTDKGYAMRTTLDSFRIGRRKTTGVQAIKMKKEEGDEDDGKNRGTPIAVKVVEEGELMFVLTKKGVGALIPTSVIRLTGRKKAGVRLMKLDDDDAIISVA